MSYCATAFAFLLLLLRQSTIAIGSTLDVTDWCGTDGSCHDQPTGPADHERNAALLQVGHQVTSEKPSKHHSQKDKDAKASLSLEEEKKGKKKKAAGKDKKAASKKEKAEAKHKKGAHDKKASKRGKKSLLQIQQSHSPVDSSLNRWENSNSNTRESPKVSRASKSKKANRKVSYVEKHSPMQKDMSTMEKVETLVERIGGIVTNKQGMKDFAASLEEDPNYRPPTGKIVHGMRKAASNDDGWLRLPSPEKGPILYHMIRSDPWDCDLVPPTDRRALTCRVPVEDSTLNPHSLTCSVDDKCAIEHANSFRTLFNVGSLPCCQTPPYCAAPTCNTTFVQQKSKKATSCSKRAAEENVAYMKDPKSWPAYHGWGGAFEMDTLKLMDALTCPDGHDCPDKMFDLVLDLGANSGYYTEKLTVRNFAKNYVLIEANPGTAGLLNERFGNEDWRKSWFEKQVPHKGSEWPEFEIVIKALSNHSEGTLDMCQTENSLADTPDGCVVPIGSVDDIVPDKLSSSFQDHYKNAESMFIKVDTEGMDELVLRGMQGLLNETRGKYKDNDKPRHLVNFLQFEFAPVLMRKAKEREQFDNYDIKTVTKFLESIGFESFLMGPRYLPMSHGSWHDDYKMWTENPNNNAGTRLNYPDFPDTVCWWCQTMDEASFTADVFAIRSSHPHAAEIKLALGACKESKDFDIHDPQYAFGEDI